MNKKCKRCGACQECGAVQPQPYTVYPQPWGINPYWRVYPNTYPGWQTSGGSTSGGISSGKFSNTLVA